MFTLEIIVLLDLAVSHYHDCLEATRKQIVITFFGKQLGDMPNSCKISTLTSAALGLPARQNTIALEYALSYQNQHAPDQSAYRTPKTIRSYQAVTRQSNL